MPYRLDWEENGYYLKMWGTVSSDDMNNALSDIWGNPKSDKMNYCIRDYLEVTKVGIEMNWEDISTYVSVYEKHATHNCKRALQQVAFLSGNKDMDIIIEGYTKAMKEHCPATNFENFDDLQSARDWCQSPH